MRVLTGITSDALLAERLLLVKLNAGSSHRHHLQRSEVRQALGEETGGLLKWRPATKSVCKTAPKYRSILSTSTVSHTQFCQVLFESIWAKCLQLGLDSTQKMFISIKPNPFSFSLSEIKQHASRSNLTAPIINSVLIQQTWKHRETKVFLRFVLL